MPRLVHGRGGDHQGQFQHGILPITQGLVSLVPKGVWSRWYRRRFPNGQPQPKPWCRLRPYWVMCCCARGCCPFHRVGLLGIGQELGSCSCMASGGGNDSKRIPQHRGQGHYAQTHANVRNSVKIVDERHGAAVISV